MHEEVWCVWTSLLLLSNDSFRLKRHDNQAINQSPIFPISTVYKKENPKREAQSKRPELTPHLHTLITTFTHSLTLPACTADWEELWSVQLKHQPVWIPLVCDVVRSQQATSLFSLVFIPKVIPVSLWGFFDSKLKPFFPPRSRHRQTEDSCMLWASANSVLLSGNLK